MGSITIGACVGSLMSNVIQFPSKNDFKSKYEGKIPDALLNDLLSAYDRVLELKNEYPTGKFVVSPGYENEAKELTDGFQNYALELLKRILELEAEICAIKHKP